LAAPAVGPEVPLPPVAGFAALLLVPFVLLDDGPELPWPAALDPAATAFPFFTTQLSGAPAFWQAVG
jgi:hypothetical protein